VGRRRQVPVVGSQLAQAVGLPKSSVFRYLSTLEARGYAERDPETDHHRLGLALLPRQARQLDLLVQAVRPYLESLRAELEETVSFAVLDGDRALQLEVMQSPRGVRTTAEPGDREPLHASAVGKALASQLDDGRVRTLLRSAGAPRLTPPRSSTPPPTWRSWRPCARPAGPSRRVPSASSQ
jgi:IclR family transcriptional regulator, acetate operon repressor